MAVIDPRTHGIIGALVKIRDADPSDFPTNPLSKIAKQALIDFDRAAAGNDRASAGEDGGGDERRRAIAVLCASTGRCRADLAEEEIDIMRNALDAVLNRTQPTPEADAVVKTADRAQGAEITATKDKALVDYLFLARAQCEEDIYGEDTMDELWDALGADRQDLTRVFVRGLNAPGAKAESGPVALTASAVAQPVGPAWLVDGKIKHEEFRSVLSNLQWLWAHSEGLVSRSTCATASAMLSWFREQNDELKSYRKRAEKLPRCEKCGEELELTTLSSVECSCGAPPPPSDAVAAVATDDVTMALRRWYTDGAPGRIFNAIDRERMAEVIAFARNASPSTRPAATEAMRGAVTVPRRATDAMLNVVVASLRRQGSAVGSECVREWWDMMVTAALKGGE